MREDTLWSTDEIILMAIKEKHSYESHPKDISYAGHHERHWLHTGIKAKPSEKTITLKQLKEIIDKQIKVK